MLLVTSVLMVSYWKMVLWIVGIATVLVLPVFALALLAYAVDTMFPSDLHSSLEPFVQPFWGSDYRYKRKSNETTYSYVVFTNGETEITIGVYTPLLWGKNRIDIKTNRGGLWSFYDSEKNKEKILNKINELIKS